jgi:alkylresorcinol/alkylpyrone synthase
LAVFIHGVASSIPDWHYSSLQFLQEISNIYPPDSFRFLSRIIEGGGVSDRFFAFPLSIGLNITSPYERANLLYHHGTSLGSSSLVKTCSIADISLERVTALLTSCCSLPITPGLDVSIATECGLSPSLLRLPTLQHGCVGGALNLSIGFGLVAANHEVALVAVELCSLVFRNSDHRKEALVGVALFGDGASSLILSSRPSKVKVIKTTQLTIPNTILELGYGLAADGFILHLSKELPLLISEPAQVLVSNLLQDLSLKVSDLKYWLLHPGGKKILTTLMTLFNIRQEACRWSWELLAKRGNISSAAIFSTLELFLKEEIYDDGDFGVIIGIGPGITLQAALLQFYR